MKKQKGVTIWFTGLSGAGKTTVAEKVEKILQGRGIYVQRLDGDISRKYLPLNLGFTKEDRNKNVSINSFIAKLLTDNDIITLCSFISPFRAARNKARNMIVDFIEVYVNAPLEVCEKRDVKGLYARAKKGEIDNFTGISAPYEPPLNPDIELRTDQESIRESANKIISYLDKNRYII